mmetsp:Transcript_53794/g.128615  ORF Transcript_53794/g.128615 Transcript_53794/m.128615 type:complete len:229 (+) Transcript_53794:1179-1865(+)
MHTMVAVRLSMIELRKKARMQMMGIRRPDFSLVLRMIKDVTTAKPCMWSMDSTIPMAGSRKRITLPTSERPLTSSLLSFSWPSADWVGWHAAAWYVHITEAKTSITADLSSRSTSSRATSRMPVKKSTARICPWIASPSMTLLGQPKKEKRKMTPNSASPTILVIRRVDFTAPSMAFSPEQFTGEPMGLLTRMSRMSRMSRTSSSSVGKLAAAIPTKTTSTFGRSNDS